MALTTGSENADAGMSQAIYQEMDRLLSPPLQAMVDSADGPAREVAQKTLADARAGWKKVAFAIASGVIAHILEHMEIVGVTTQGSIRVTIENNAGIANNVVFQQNNDGPGRVR